MHVSDALQVIVVAKLIAIRATKFCVKICNLDALEGSEFVASSS